MPKRIEEDYNRNNAISPTFMPKLPLLGMEVMKFLFLFSLPYGCYIPNLIKIGPVVFEKMLTHDALRTIDDDGRQPIAIVHLINSGDLQIYA